MSRSQWKLMAALTGLVLLVVGSTAILAGRQLRSHETERRARELQERAALARELARGVPFDPSHAAHLEVAEAAGKLLGADRVSFVPAWGPPHKPDGANASPQDPQ